MFYRKNELYCRHYFFAYENSVIPEQLASGEANPWWHGMIHFPLHLIHNMMNAV